MLSGLNYILLSKSNIAPLGTETKHERTKATTSNNQADQVSIDE